MNVDCGAEKRIFEDGFGFDFQLTMRDFNGSDFEIIKFY